MGDTRGGLSAYFVASIAYAPTHFAAGMSHNVRRTSTNYCVTN